MEVRVAQASAVFVQHVPAAAKDKFLQWQRGIARVAESFAGYAGTDVYPPGDKCREQWVVVQHFDDDESLQQWLRSPVRLRWIQEIQAEMGECHTTQLSGGFASWFVDRVQNEAPPAGWKMALAVLLGLYPTVMLLTLYFPGPFTNTWNIALAMLLSNALSVSVLQWAIMPVLNKILGPWLQADRKSHARLVYGGLALIFVALAAQCALFWQLSG